MGKKKEKRPLSSDSDSGPDDREPAPKQKFSKNPYKKEPVPKRPAASSGAGGGEETDADGNPMWDLGNNKKVCVRDFKGKTYVDIREYYVARTPWTRSPARR